MTGHGYDAQSVVTVLCTGAVVLAVLPVLAGLYQYLLVAFSPFATHLEGVSSKLPRVAILVPAWNEGAVIGRTIDRLVALDYPADKLRVYVIDDASNDGTPEIVIARSKLYRDRVFHIRRVSGGEGKAHTLNYGLDTLWRSDWAEAVLIMDADVIYELDALRKMARHLADPEVGAVTAYIKEGSAAPNYVQRFIAFEYITATGAGRRAQNVLGFLVCLSGGAQLHTRENLQAIGGQIFSDTLAEDTFTTFLSQLAGRKVLFEPNAVAWAEEPDTLHGLWKQRLRWARGNVQISLEFRNLWLRPSRHRGLGSFSMALLWFAIFTMPVIQIAAAVSLDVLFFLDPAWAWSLFRSFWILSGLVYLVITLCSLVIDPVSARKSWRQGFLFPGWMSLSVIVYTLWPPLIDSSFALFDLELGTQGRTLLTLFLYSWLALGMVVSYAGCVVEQHPRWRWLAPALLHLGGYGALLCAVTFGAYVKELQGADKTWDKTIKTGKVA